MPGRKRYTRGFLEPWTRITIEADEITSFRGAKAIRLESFRERAEAFEAAGLGRSGAD